MTAGHDDRSGRRIVAFPFHDWRKAQSEGVRTRDGHLIESFANRQDVDRVLVVDRPTSAAERRARGVSGHVLGDRVATWDASPGAATLTRVGPSIDVLDIALPDLLGPVVRRRGWWFDVFTKPNVGVAIDRAVERSLGDATDVVAWVPTVAPVMFRSGGRVVFDSLDNWLIHPVLRRYSQEAGRAYGEILSRAERVVVSGAASAHVLERWRTDIEVIPNGVEPAVFREDAPRPEDLPAPPVVGYAGKLADRIDDQFVAATADAMPGVQFVFVGPVLDQSAVREMRRRANVHLLGDRSYDRLPAYVRAFDVAWIPHRVGEGETGGDPIKLYEYWAAGRQVVSTRIDGSSAWEPQARLVTGYAEAVSAISGILDKSLPMLPTIIPPGRTWSEIASQLLDHHWEGR